MSDVSKEFIINCLQSKFFLVDKSNFTTFFPVMSIDFYCEKTAISNKEKQLLLKHLDLCRTTLKYKHGCLPANLFQKIYTYNTYNIDSSEKFFTYNTEVYCMKSDEKQILIYKNSTSLIKRKLFYNSPKIIQRKNDLFIAPPEISKNKKLQVKIINLLKVILPFAISISFIFTTFYLRASNSYFIYIPILCIASYILLHLFSNLGNNKSEDKNSTEDFLTLILAFMYASIYDSPFKNVKTQNYVVKIPLHSSAFRRIGKTLEYRFISGDKININGSFGLVYAFVITLYLQAVYGFKYYIEKGCINLYKNTDNSGVAENITVLVSKKYLPHATKYIETIYTPKYLDNDFCKFVLKSCFDSASSELTDIESNILLDDLLCINTKSIVRSWNYNTSGLACIPAVTSSGIYKIDFIKNGPHGLICGTTGSGKSEALVAIIVSLCLSYSPEYLRFILIDYKAGTTFKALEHLPHVIGVFDDLHENMTVRCMSFLQSELKRREELFLAKGVKNIDEYNKCSVQIIPKILVVIDEFLALSKENFAVLDSLVTLSTKGRSLGIHILLATQKVSSTVPDSIKVNTSLRILFNVPDSSEHIHFNSTSARLPCIAGRASIEQNIVQFAWVGSFNSSTWNKILYEINKSCDFKNIDTDLLSKERTSLQSLENKITFDGNIMFSERNNYPLEENNIYLGIADLVYKQEKIPMCLSGCLHNFSKPSYDISIYIQHILFQSQKNILTILLTSFPQQYQHVNIVSKNLVVLDYKDINHTLNVIYHYLKLVEDIHHKHPKLFFIIDDYEIFNIFTQRASNEYENLIFTHLITSALKEKIILLVVSAKPLNNFKKYIFTCIDENEKYIWLSNTKVNLLNAENANLQGRLLVQHTLEHKLNKDWIALQLPTTNIAPNNVNDSCNEIAVNIGYSHKLPKLFSYSMKNTELSTKTLAIGNNNKFLYGVKYLSLEHLYLSKNQKYIVYTDSQFQINHFKNCWNYGVDTDESHNFLDTTQSDYLSDNTCYENIKVVFARKNFYSNNIQKYIEQSDEVTTLIYAPCIQDIKFFNLPIKNVHIPSHFSNNYILVLSSNKYTWIQGVQLQ